MAAISSRWPVVAGALAAVAAVGAAFAGAATQPAGTAPAFLGRALLVAGDGSIVLGGFASAAKPRGESDALTCGFTDRKLVRSFRVVTLSRSGAIRRRYAVSRRAIRGCAESIAGLGVDANGALVVAGTVYRHGTLADGESRFTSSPVLVRFRADGSLDRGFGGGVVYTGLPTAEAAVQPDGRIVSGAGFRYGADGTPERDFRAEIMTAGLPADVEVLATGAFVSANYEPLRARELTIQRFTKDGARDAAFGRAGRVSSTFTRRPPDAAELTDLAVHPHGVAVLGSYLPRGEVRPRVFVFRSTAAGVADRRFGAGGLVELGLPYPGTAHQIALDARGGLLVSGAYDGAGRHKAFVARYDDRGRPDRGFGAGGRVVVDLGRRTDRFPQAATGVAVAAGGRIVGFATVRRDGPTVVYALTRRGRFDRGFAGDGRLTLARA